MLIASRREGGAGGERQARRTSITMNMHSQQQCGENASSGDIWVTTGELWRAANTGPVRKFFWLLLEFFMLVDVGGEFQG